MNRAGDVSNNLSSRLGGFYAHRKITKKCCKQRLFFFSVLSDARQFCISPPIKFMKFSAFHFSNIIAIIFDGISLAYNNLSLC